MERKRIIARIDIKNTDLVKGIQLEGLRVLGDPIEASKYYYKENIDEIILVDVVASLYERNSLSGFIKEIAKEVFVPITVAGGIRNLNDIKTALKSGADKISLNTAAIKDIDFVRKAIKEFGSSTIVVNIEASYHLMNEFYCFTDNGREFTGVKTKEWINTLIDLEVGEIILTSIDLEGTGEGYDKHLIELIPNDINIPLIYHGGLHKEKHVIQLLKKYPHVDGVALASALHYRCLNSINSTEIKREGNIDFISSIKSSFKQQNDFIKDLKTQCKENGIPTRA